MTLDRYQEEWTKDAPLRLDALDEDARTLYQLHAKWWKYYTAERLRFRKLELDFRQLKRLRWEYWAGKLDDAERTAHGWPVQPLKILSPNLETYLQADPILQELQKKLILVEETLAFLENIIKAINQRSYTIKTTVDFLRFKQGL